MTKKKYVVLCTQIGPTLKRGDVTDFAKTFTGLEQINPDLRIQELVSLGKIRPATEAEASLDKVTVDVDRNPAMEERLMQATARNQTLEGKVSDLERQLQELKFAHIPLAAVVQAKDPYEPLIKEKDRVIADLQSKLEAATKRNR